MYPSNLAQRRSSWGDQEATFDASKVTATIRSGRASLASQNHFMTMRAAERQQCREIGLAYNRTTAVYGFCLTHGLGERTTQVLLFEIAYSSKQGAFQSCQLALNRLRKRRGSDPHVRSSTLKAFLQVQDRLAQARWHADA